MANRPGKLCNLQSGKAIGAQVHSSFADTFNWLVACMKNLKAGKGCKVNWPSSDTPEIECTIDPIPSGTGTGGGGGGGGEGEQAKITITTDSGTTTPSNAVSIVGASGMGLHTSADGTTVTITPPVYDRGVTDVRDDGVQQTASKDDIQRLVVEKSASTKNLDIQIGAKMTGTNNLSTNRVQEIKWKTATDSNVEVKPDTDGETLIIGVYYL